MEMGCGGRYEAEQVSEVPVTLAKEAVAAVDDGVRYVTDANQKLEALTWDQARSWSDRH